MIGRACLTCGLVAWAVASGAVRAGDPRAAHDEAGRALVERFLARDADPLTSYRATRHLQASTRGGAMHASMTVLTTMDPQAGFEYAVLDESGSGLIRRKVFAAALDAERRVRQPAEAARGALTEDNYDFIPAGVSGDGLLKIEISPRRTDTLLVRGSILVTGDDADLVRIEGLLVKRPSFWTAAWRSCGGTHASRGCASQSRCNRSQTC